MFAYVFTAGPPICTGQNIAELLYPGPTCRQYYVCYVDLTKPELKTCRASTYFNFANQRCDADFITDCEF